MACGNLQKAYGNVYVVLQQVLTSIGVIKYLLKHFQYNF